MKFDITKLPVLEAVLGFLLIVLVITFVLAFQWASGETEEDSTEVSGSPSPTSGGVVGNEVAISLGDNSFDPEEIAVAADQEITFNLTNDGSAVHNMRIAGADNEYDSGDDAVSDPDLLAGGDEGVVTWTSPSDAGEIDFRCDFHPVEMTGTITVQ